MAGGGFDREIQINRVRNGTHHFLGGSIQKSVQIKKKVELGIHNFQDSIKARTKALNRIKNGTHHFLTSDFNKKAFTFYCNNIPYKRFTSKVEAVKDGIPEEIKC